MFEGQLVTESDRTVGARLDPRDLAIVMLGKELRTFKYQFTTVTPLSHGRSLNRADEGTTLRDVFGWNRTFGKSEHLRFAIELLADAGELAVEGSQLRSKLRFATLGEHIFVHSSYPTKDEAAVFFGPDSYRFCRAISQYGNIGGSPALRIVDLGCGTGVGGLHAAVLAPGAASEISLIDINERALRFARINMAINDAMHVRFIRSDLFANFDGRADLVVANPPYLIDRSERFYRHGGRRGFDLSLRIVAESVDRLAPGGRLILYTGVAVIDGIDPFRMEAQNLLGTTGHNFIYEEIDPDVFGEELECKPYDRADRIAAVALVVDANNNKRMS